MSDPDKTLEVRAVVASPQWGPWSEVRTFVTAADEVTPPPPEPEPPPATKPGNGKGWGKGGKR